MHACVCVCQLSELIPGNLLSLIRYVGFTPKSSDLRQILLGLCSQIALALGYMPDDIPNDFKDLQRFFPELLAAIPVDTTVVIILDALEQVGTEGVCVGWVGWEGERRFRGHRRCHHPGCLGAGRYVCVGGGKAVSYTHLTLPTKIGV